jgi:hypothetical protein
MAFKFRYVTIAAEVKNEQQHVNELLGMLTDGWAIIANTGVEGGVHYVLVKDVAP